MTILIPAKNADRYIKRALISVFNQTRNDWDVQLLVDCATTDNTYRKARDVISKSLRRRSIHLNISKKPGLPQVYKELIDRAEPHDDICGFLDADDRLQPGAVEMILKCYASKPSLGHVWSQFVMAPRGHKGWSRRLPPNRTLRESFVAGWWGAQHWRTFRKSAYLSSEYSLQLDIPFATDYNLALVLAASNCEGFHLAKQLYVYYVTPGGITQSKQKQQRTNFNEMLRRFKMWSRKRTACESSSRKSMG